MLRRAENIIVLHQRQRMFSTNGYVTIAVGKESYRLDGKIPEADFHALKQQQSSYPVRWARIGERTYYEFRSKFYWDNDDLTVEQVHALLVTREQAKQRRIDRAQAMVAIGIQPTTTARAAIPDDVRQYVMKRDAGRCVSCGTNSGLQFDHVIPIAMGVRTNRKTCKCSAGPATAGKAPA